MLDQKRARCPCFSAREDWKRESYIYCNKKHFKFSGKLARDRQYLDRCCGDYENCAVYRFSKTRKGEAGHDRNDQNRNARCNDLSGV